MSAWILWRSILRMGYPENLPLWKTKPDIFDSKEECQSAKSMVIAEYINLLKKNPDFIEAVTITDDYMEYVIKDHTHPSGKRDVVVHWLPCPAGFNPNEPH